MPLDPLHWVFKKDSGHLYQTLITKNIHDFQQSSPLNASKISCCFFDFYLHIKYIHFNFGQSQKFKLNSNNPRKILNWILLTGTGKIILID